jgi:hypothetical protein
MSIILTRTNTKKFALTKSEDVFLDAYLLNGSLKFNWIKINLDTDRAAFETGEELVVSSLGSSGVAEWRNMVYSSLNRTFGIWGSTAYIVMSVDNTGVTMIAPCSFGITNTDHTNRVEFYHKTATDYLTFRIIYGGAEQYEITDVTKDFIQFYINITEGGDILAYKYTGSAWSQIGITENYSVTGYGDMSLFAMTTGGVYTRMGLQDSYITISDILMI